MKPIKPYAQVKVGDMAFENPDAGGEWDNETGKVPWKGTMDELNKSPYAHLLKDWNSEDDVVVEEYDLIVIQTTGWDGGPTLFNYNNDPCGVVVFDNPE